MRDDFSASFTRDMNPVLGAHFLEWLPFGTECISSTLREFIAPERLGETLELDTGSYDPAVVEAAWVDPLRSYLQRTGKMLRPYLVSLCLEAYGCDPNRYAHEIAIAELIQSSSLILDDVVDDSLFRHGGLSAHKQVGVRIAGAAASAWLNLAFEIVWHDRNLLGPETAGHIIEEIAWEHFVTGLGTVLDVTWPWNRRTDHLPEEYLQQVVHRTGSYSYRMPLKIGGLAAAVPESEVARLASFGEQLGLAFQIIDDVLNVRPGDEYWGKEVAEDVAQGKINLQVILALRAAEPEERRRLEEILNSRSHDPTMLAEAVRVIETSGALEESRNIARRLRDEAVSIVDTLQMDEVHRHRLKALAEYVLRRTR